MNQPIPLSVPNLKGNELKYIQKAIEEEWVSTAGACITEFENAVGEYIGAGYAAACQSGTAGLHLAILALRIGPGDEVIVPALTFIAAVNPVKYAGAEPVFMDCDKSLTMDVIKLEQFCREECEMTENGLLDSLTGRMVKAILVVHVFGNMADMEAITGIAERYGLKLIEDATEALGTYYEGGTLKGRFAGTIGDIGVFSFNGNKIITTGGGGMVVSNHKEYVDQCRYLSSQAKDDSLYFIHEEIGYNYRMTNLQAAMGLAQLEQLEEFIKNKEKNYRTYREAGLTLLPFRQGIRPNYWFYSCMTEDRDGLIGYLGEKKIQARPVWKLIPTLKPYENARSYRVEEAFYFYDRIVNLPCSSNLSTEDVERVAEAVLNYSRRQGGSRNWS